MNDFITKLRTADCFYKYLLKDNVIGVYLAGSTCLGLDDEESDYDILILTDGDDHADISKEMYIKYKGKRFHWYYFPIKDLFNFFYSTDLRILCPVQLFAFFRQNVIYENPKFNDLLTSIEQIKFEISKLAIYSLFEAFDSLLNKIISQNNILQEDYTKYLYHLSYSACILLNKPFDTELLLEIKRIRRKSIEQQYKDQAVTLLKQGLEYIKANPINYREELINLYDRAYRICK